jgi:hypothetical protein
MRKLKLPLLLLGLVLSFAALPVPTASAGPQCLCEILCWDNGVQLCWQDECCHLTCCDKSDPTCWSPCF